MKNPDIFHENLGQLATSASTLLGSLSSSLSLCLLSQVCHTLPPTQADLAPAAGRWGKDSIQLCFLARVRSPQSRRSIRVHTAAAAPALFVDSNRDLAGFCQAD